MLMALLFQEDKCFIHFIGAIGSSLQVRAKARRYAQYHGKHPAVFSIHYNTRSSAVNERGEEEDVTVEKIQFHPLLFGGDQLTAE